MGAPLCFISPWKVSLIIMCTTTSNQALQSVALISLCAFVDLLFVFYCVGAHEVKKSKLIKAGKNKITLFR